MLHFGGTFTVTSFVTYFAYNLDKILLGRFWGTSTLGSIPGLTDASISRTTSSITRSARSHLAGCPGFSTIPRNTRTSF